MAYSKWRDNVRKGLQIQWDWWFFEQDKTKFIAKVASYNLLGTNDEQRIKQYLVKAGPLAIALNADTLMTYKLGTIDESPEQCDPQGLNHAVVVIGYGKADKEYWIARNLLEKCGKKKDILELRLEKEDVE